MVFVILAQAFGATPTEIAALLVGVAGVITALGTAVAAIIVALSTGRKVDVVATKADVIHALVNTSASAATAKIELMQAELNVLHGLLAEQKAAAALLAQAAVARDHTTPAPGPLP